MAVTAVTSTDFTEKVLGSDRPVLVDFWADWCPPCHMLTPILERVAAAEAERMAVVKVDVEADPELADAYGVQAFPTLKLFRGGEPVAEIVGVVAQQSLLDALAPHL